MAASTARLSASAPAAARAGWRGHVHRYGGDLRLLSLSLLIGVAAGLGALLFKAALDLFTRLLLVDIGGDAPATTLGEGFLDVREPLEREGYIEGAVQVPRGVLEFQADPASPRHDAALDPDRRVIVFCRSGARATLAGATLVRLGFTEVACLDGGFAAWKDAGLPTVAHHDGL